MTTAYTTRLTALIPAAQAEPAAGIAGGNQVFWVDGFSVISGMPPSGEVSDFQYPVAIGAANVRGSFSYQLVGSISVFGIFTRNLSDLELEDITL
jgi:hypothetical protein